MMKQWDQKTHRRTVRFSTALRLLGTAALAGTLQWGLMVQPLKAEAAKAPDPSANNTLEWVKVAISGAGTLATIVGGVVLYLNFRVANRNAALTESRLITERFSKAVEQLGSDKLEVRLGGIYALERIAQDSSRDHWTIMEVLTAFVRKKSPVAVTQPQAKQSAILEPTEPVVESTPVTEDVQAALTVIGRRWQQYDPKDARVDLSGSHLSGVNLRDANLNGAYLSNANLNGAYLTRAALSGVNFSGTDLSGANLFNANLTFANLSNASLTFAFLLFADLLGAQGLTDEQLRSAKLCRTTLPDGTISDRDCEALGIKLPNSSAPADPPLEPPRPPMPPPV